jgi:hypothetical protein
MEETKKSLKAYFIVIGIYGIIVNISEIFLYSEVSFTIFRLIQLFLSSLFIYFGVKLYYYLEKSPETLINFVIIIISAMSILYLIAGGLLHLIVLMLLGWYLVHNIKKLSLQQPEEAIKEDNKKD